jgi:hypothetical protein
MRSVIAVIAGYLVFGGSAGLLFGLSGRDPKVWPGIGFAAFSTLYGMAFAFRPAASRPESRCGTPYITPGQKRGSSRW